MVLNVVGSSPISHPPKILNNRKVVEDFFFLSMSSNVKANSKNVLANNENAKANGKG